MSLPDEKPRAAIEALRQRAELARERAALCEARAEFYEAGPLPEYEAAQKSRAAKRDLHRRLASRHLMSAQMHELLAVRLEAWHGRKDADIRPMVMDAIAGQLGMASALATVGQHHALAMVAASDRTAQAAHDLELVVAEGPVTDAADGAVLTSVGANLVDRWPHYGPAVAELGIRAVCAAPLGSPTVGIGALCAYDTVPATPRRASTAMKLMADALSQMLLGGSALASPDEEMAILGFLDASDNRSIVLQAVGMVRVQCGCQLEDAADLLVARAFADGNSVPEVARQIVRGELQLQ